MHNNAIQLMRLLCELTSNSKTNLWKAKLLVDIGS